VHSDRLLFAPLAGAPVSPATFVLPTSLAVAVTDQQCPPLRGLFPGLSFQNGAFRVRGERGSATYSIALQAGVWQVSPPIDNGNNIWIADVRDGHAGDIRVFSPALSLGANNGFSVRDILNATTVATGTVVSPRTWVNLGQVQRFYDYPGYPHQVHGQLSADSELLYPLLRYGIPDAGSATSALRLGRSDIRAGLVYVGSPEAVFSVSVTQPAIALEAVLTQPVPRLSYLLMGLGFRGPGASPDPVSGSGAAARLQFLVALSVEHNLIMRTQSAIAAVQMPNLEFLVDSVLLTQWAFPDPNDPQNPNALVYSDICGARFLPGSNGALASSAAGTTAHQIGHGVCRNRLREELEKDTRRVPAGPMLAGLRARAGM
jgi:hypothetical protein